MAVFNEIFRDKQTLTTGGFEDAFELFTLSDDSTTEELIGFIFVGDVNGDVYKFDLEGNSLSKNTSTHTNEIHYITIFDADKIAIASEDGTTSVLNKSDLSVVWTKSFSDQFPRSLGVNSSNYVWAVGRAYTWNYISDAGSVYGSGVNLKYNPKGVTIDSNDNAYISSTGSGDSIDKYDSTRAHKLSITPSGSPMGILYNTNDGYLYCVLQNGSIIKLDTSLNVVASNSIGTKLFSLDIYNSDIYVTDYDGDSVYKTDTNLNLVWSYNITNPNGVSVDFEGKYVYISTSDGIVDKLSSSKDFIYSITLDANIGFNNPLQITKS